MKGLLDTPPSLQPTLPSISIGHETHAVFAWKYASCRSLCSASIRSWHNAAVGRGVPFFGGSTTCKEMSGPQIMGFAEQKTSGGKKTWSKQKEIQDLWGMNLRHFLFFWMASRSSVSWRARSWRQDSSDFPKSCRFASYSVIITALSNIIDQYDSHLL